MTDDAIIEAVARAISGAPESSTVWLGFRSPARAAIAAHTAALAEAGWAIVPRYEPLDPPLNAIVAGVSAVSANGHFENDGSISRESVTAALSDALRAGYLVMITAAPKPPGGMP